MSRPSRRSLRNLLLDVRFQLKWAMALAAAGGVIFGSMSLMLYEKVRDNTALLGLGGDDPFERELLDRLHAADGPLAWQLAGFCAALMGVLFLVGVLATHRIVGPLRVVEGSVATLAEGGTLPSNRVLRQGDEFQTLFGRVNALGHSLEGARVRDAEIIERALERLRGRLEGAPESVERSVIEGWFGEALAELEALAGEKRGAGGA